MIVVSDTTPLNYLVLIKAIDVLPALFSVVYVPPEVINELTKQGAPAAVREWAKSPPSWVKVVAPSSLLPSTEKLDLGEREAISLAKELNIKDVLLDERRGCKVAVKEGLFPLPTLAIVERAGERKLLDVPQAIEKLRQTTIRIEDTFYEAALKRDIQRKIQEKQPQTQQQQAPEQKRRIKP